MQTQHPTWSDLVGFELNMLSRPPRSRPEPQLAGAPGGEAVRRALRPRSRRRNKPGAGICAGRTRRTTVRTADARRAGPYPALGAEGCRGGSRCATTTHSRAPGCGAPVRGRRSGDPEQARGTATGACARHGAAADVACRRQRTAVSAGRRQPQRCTEGSARRAVVEAVVNRDYVLRTIPTSHKRITEPRTAVNNVKHQPPPAVLRKKLSRKPPIRAPMMPMTMFIRMPEPAALDDLPREPSGDRADDDVADPSHAGQRARPSQELGCRNDFHDELLPVASKAQRLLRHSPVYPPSVTIRRANRLRKRCSTGFAQPPGIISGGAFCTGTGTPTSGRCPGATGVAAAEERSGPVVGLPAEAAA